MAAVRAGSVGGRQDPTTLPIPVVTADRRRRKRRGRRALVVLLIVLVVLAALAVVAYVVGERVFRSTAEAQIEQTVAQRLPAGVTGEVDARIGDGSALLQYLQGSFDDVTLTSRGLRVAGAPASAVVHVAGLPVAGGAIERATADLTIDQAAFRAVPALRNAGASAPQLGNGTVSTTLTRTFLGLDLKVAVRLKPSLTDQTVRLTPTSATLTAGPATIPATAIVQQLLPDGVSVCAASYLPRGVELTSVAVRPREAVVRLTARDVDLNTLDSAQTGSCG
ncbi:DUF2993 domain-containing protein [uncultured Amnibacterium sp.]|uniref:LmeA family phospholipid-binding protein n=1 Tax=uncultured Amnibacterium sp. TaxID=1631851 RepID=UPI0035CA9782